MKKRIVIIASIILIMIVFLSIFIFIKDNDVKISLTDDEIKLKENYEKYNNIEYDGVVLKKVIIESDNNVEYATSKNIVDWLKKDTNIIIFANECDNLSRDIVPFVINFLKKNNIEKYYYYDSQNIKEDNVYKKIVNILYNKELESDLIIPTIVFIKDGKILGLYSNNKYDEEEIKEKITYYLDILNPTVCSTDERC